MLEFLSIHFFKQFILLMISFVLVLVYLSYSLDNYKLTLIPMGIATSILFSFISIIKKQESYIIPGVILISAFIILLSSLIVYIAYNQYMIEINNQTGELLPLTGAYKTRYDDFQHTMALYLISSIVVIFNYNNIKTPETRKLIKPIMYISAITMVCTSIYNVYLAGPFIGLVRNII